MNYVIVSKDDIPDEPDTLHADVIEALRDEAGQNPIAPGCMPKMYWVRSARKWGFADLDSHWLFAFAPCPPTPPMVILPPPKIITIAPIEPPNPYIGGAL